MIRARYADRSLHHRQEGATLIEAMVATLLLMILMLGLTFALSHTLVVQRHTNAQNIAVLELREQAHRVGLSGLCDGGSNSVSISAQTVTIATSSCTSPAISVSTNVSGNAYQSTLPAGFVPGVGASVSTTSSDLSQNLFGGDGVISFSYQ